MFADLRALVLLSALLKTSGGDCSGRAYFLALTATDTLGMVRVLDRVHLHLARPGAGSAAGAFALVGPVAKYRNGIEYGIDSPQGTDVFAEGTVDNDGQKDRDNEQHVLPGIQPAQGAVHGSVQQDQRDTAFQRAHRTQQLAEIGRPLPHDVHQEHGEQDHKEQKDKVFQFPQQLVSAEGLHLLWKGDLVQEVLDQAEGTQPAADEPAHQRPDKDQESGHIEGEFEIPAPDDRLKGADGTGAKRTGTGVTVHPWYTEIFQFAPVNLSPWKAGQIAVGQQRPESLNPMTGPFTCFPPSQFRYTPSKY